MSLQSGCTDTLKRMNRKYTKEDIIEVSKDLRDNFKDTMLTADIIVGFPGETDEEFQESFELLKQLKLYKIHVFQYSKRENTRAAEFTNQVLPEKKEERSKILIELSDRDMKEYNMQYIGKEIKVLVEEKDGFDFKGHCENYMCVLIKGASNDIRNEIVSVKLVGVQNEALIGNVQFE